MLPELEIRVLFCYSPEVLADTYNNFEQLDEDNNLLCQVTDGILKQNITTYNVSVQYVCSLAVENLQTQWYFHNTCLNLSQVHGLATCTSSTAFYIGCKFGQLPQYLLTLKETKQATVLVLQVKLCNNPKEYGISAVSAAIGVLKPEELLVVIARENLVKGHTIFSLEPTLLAHEFGHLMGCRHTVGSSPESDNIEGDSHGHALIDNSGNMLVGTLMSYAQHTILYYSNPNIFQYPPPFHNFPCGAIGISEAYKTVNANIQKLAGIF